jgi:glutamate synthase (NADPH/NADH) small chain
MYGIPNMKLPKWVVERRVKLMVESGIEFCLGVDAAAHAEEIAADSAAIVLACGAKTPRCLDAPGAELSGVHYALDYLGEATKALMENREASISAAGKDVAVIGGGDTGVDCVATALRQGAKSVVQIVRAKRPRVVPGAFDAWPASRNGYTQGYGQREAEEAFGHDPRIWATDTMAFVDDGLGSVTAVQTRPIPDDGSSCELPAQLVLIAKGFTGPEQATIDAFSGYRNVYRAGDARLGSTLVATAMADAIQVAQRVSREIRA